MQRQIRDQRCASKSTDENFMWFEDLPVECPPNAATEVVVPETFYRLAQSPIITDEDFWSHRKLWPNKVFKTTECITRAVSIHKNIEDCQKLKMLSAHKDKVIVSIVLSEGSGRVQQTFKPSHHSWWRKSTFNPVAAATIRL